MYLMKEFEKLKTGLEYKVAKRMQIDLVLRLITKLNELLIDDDELVRMFEDLLRFAVDHAEGRESGMRFYRKQKSLITDYVLKTHKLAYKGYYTAVFMALGFIFGSTLGLVFMTTINTAFYALGVGPGIAIGVSIGAGKEKKAQKEGLIY